MTAKLTSTDPAVDVAAVVDNNLNSLQSRAGTIIITHRTPPLEAIEALTAALYAYLQETNANECIVVEFSKKPIFFKD